MRFRVGWSPLGYSDAVGSKFLSKESDNTLTSKSDTTLTQANKTDIKLQIITTLLLR